MASTTSERRPLLGSRAHNQDVEQTQEESPSTGANNDAVEVDDGVGTARGLAIIVATGILLFFQATNMSMITTIQSSIAEDLDAYDNVTWFTSAYLVAMSSFAPVMGRLSQIFSPRRCIFASSIIFSVGAVITASARTFEIFITGRAVCGVGGAGILTVAMIIVLQLSSVKRRGLLIGMLNSVYTIGVALGAVAAGGLLPHIGWRGLFWVQPAFALTAGFAMFQAIPNRFSKPREGIHEQQSLLTKLKKLDYLGAVSLILCITFILIGVSGAEILLVPLGIGLILIPVFVLNEAYLARDPVVPVKVLKSRGTLLSCLSTAGFMICRWSVLFYTPVYSIAVRGWDPAVAGATLVPTNAGFALGGLIVGATHIKRSGSFYTAALATFVFFPVTLVLLAFGSTATIHPALYLLAIFVNGFTAGASLNYTLAHVLHLTLPETHFIVTSLLATFRGFAGSFGSAVGGGIFTRILRASLKAGFAWHGRYHEDELIRKLLGSPALVSKLPPLDRDIAVAGYEEALRGLFLAAAGLAAITIFAQAGTGWKAPHGKKVDDDDENDGIAVTADAQGAAVDPVDGIEPVPRSN